MKKPLSILLVLILLLSIVPASLASEEAGDASEEIAEPDVSETEVEPTEEPAEEVDEEPDEEPGEAPAGELIEAPTEEEAPPALDGDTTTVYASSLQDDEILVLTGTTKLVMDVNKTLRSIYGGYALTVEGSGRLTVNDPVGNGIAAASVKSTAPITVTAGGIGIYAAYQVDISGNLSVTAGESGVYCKNGDIVLNGNSVIRSDKDRAIYAPWGSIAVAGDLDAASWSAEVPCIEAASVEGGSEITWCISEISISSDHLRIESYGTCVRVNCGSVTITSPDAVITSNNGIAVQAIVFQLEDSTWGRGDVTLSGSIALTGGACGVANGGTLRVKSGKVTAAGGSLGINTNTLQVSRGASLIASGVDAVHAESFQIASENKIRKPSGGYVKDNTIVTSSGTIATEIEIGWAIDGVELSAENFPDDAFRIALGKDWDLNKDDYLSYAEMNVQNSLHLGSSNLASLQGIELLGGVPYLYAYHTKLTSFDGKDSPGLVVLDLSDCALDSLDVSTCSDLRELLLSGGTGTLSDLDLSGNPELRVLETYDSHITTYLDISTCPHLVDAALHGEVIKYGSGANATTAYHISSRNYLRTDGYGNETVAHFDEAFPDAGFRALLQNDKNLNWDKNNDLSISEAKNVKYLLPEDSEEGIQSLAGIEFFPNLIHLSAFNCRIGELDVSKNKALTYLDLGGNLDLDRLDVSMLPLLEDLDCARNGMSELLLGSHDSLKTLRAYDNALTELDLSGLPSLTYLDLDMNALKSLDVSQNPALTTLFVSNNSLTELDVSQNTALKSLACFGNGIESLDISQSPNLLSAYRGTREEKTDADTGVTYYRYSDGTNVLCVDKDTVMVTGAETGLLGDVDKNGRIEPADAAMVLRDPSSCEVSVGDVSSDNAVNAYDAALILQYSVDKITKFPAENNL